MYFEHVLFAASQVVGASGGYLDTSKNILSRESTSE